MNILYITFTSRGGGATTALANLVKGITAMGHRVWVMTNNTIGPLPDMIEAAGGTVLYGPVSLTVYPMNGRFLGRVMRLIKSLFLWRETRRLVYSIIKELNIQVVHSNVGPMNLALKACQKAKIPHVWHLREYQDLDFKMHFFPSKVHFNRLIHKVGNFNVAISKGLFEYYNLRMGVDTVVYDGVFSEADVNASFFAKKEDFFLFVGRIEEAKGPHHILKPFCEFKALHPSFRLLFAGSFNADDSYYLELIKKIGEYDLVDSVVFLGNRDDIYDLMKKARALIVSSRFEGFGFITAEAMLNNCLVIGNDTAGTKEQFDVGLELTGQEIAFRYHTEDELLDSLRKAVDEDTSQIRQFARQVVSKKYTLEEHARQIERFYISCLNEYYHSNI